jgi:hypothetical protein
MPVPDFRLILSDSSRSLMDYAASMVGDDKQLFGEMMVLAYRPEHPLCMRAARVADLCCEKHPGLIRPYLVQLVRDLPELKNMSVKRIFMHILIRHSWVEDEEAMSKLIDTLFKWLMDDAQSVAVKAYAIVILENIANLLPDLKSEMIVVLEETMPFWDSCALQGAGRRVVERLRKTS